MALRVPHSNFAVNAFFSRESFTQASFWVTHLDSFLAIVEHEPSARLNGAF
jgi:hypothetical protein